jgi:hypothetical protein
LLSRVGADDLAWQVSDIAIFSYLVRRERRASPVHGKEAEPLAYQQETVYSTALDYEND